MKGLRFVLCVGVSVTGCSLYAPAISQPLNASSRNVVETPITCGQVVQGYAQCVQNKTLSNCFISDYVHAALLAYDHEQATKGKLSIFDKSNPKNQDHLMRAFATSITSCDGPARKDIKADGVIKQAYGLTRSLTTGEQFQE